MRLALALYDSTAHASTPHCDLDLLYHDPSAHRWTSASLAVPVSSPRCTLVWRSASANLKTGTVRHGESRREWPGELPFRPGRFILHVW